MILNAKDYASILLERLEDAPANEHQRIIDDFCHELTSNHHEKILPEILSIIDKHKTENIISIQTSDEINSADAKELENFAAKLFPEIKKPEFVFTVKKDLIGGFCIRAKDKEYNQSINQKLQDIKEKLWKN